MSSKKYKSLVIIILFSLIYVTTVQYYMKSSANFFSQDISKILGQEADNDDSENEIIEEDIFFQDHSSYIIESFNSDIQKFTTYLSREMIYRDYFAEIVPPPPKI